MIKCGYEFKCVRCGSGELVQKLNFILKCKDCGNEAGIEECDVETWYK